MQTINDWISRDLLDHRAIITPSAIALIDPELDVTLSFCDLDSLVDDVAQQLVNIGINPGDHIGLLVSNKTEFVILIHALLRIQAVLVPLNRQLSTATIQDHLLHADVSCIIANDDAQHLLTQTELPIAIFSANSTLQHTNLNLKQATDFKTSTRSSQENRQVLMFTSGTTSTPKAVSITNHNLVSSAIASGFRLGMNESVSWLCCLPLYHMGGFAPIIRSLIYGNRLVVQQEFEPTKTIDLVDTHTTTGVSVVPTMLERLLGESWCPPDHLQTVLTGGAPTPPDLRDRCKEAAIPVYPTYGLTETSSQIATATPSVAFEHKETSGNPLLFTDVTILDTTDNTPVEPGHTGEIVVDGPSVTTEYYENPKANADAFSSHGFHTGDVGYLDQDGRLWVTGRIDDQIITGGENVNPREIREVLQRHPKIDAAFVLGIPDDEWGEIIGALVVPSSTITQEELKDYCRERLPRFMVPRIIQFASALPRTHSGTIDRNKATEMLKQ